jgi:hypothetical protein
MQRIVSDERRCVTPKGARPAPEAQFFLSGLPASRRGVVLAGQSHQNRL